VYDYRHEIESPGLPLVGLAVMLEITRSGNDATAVTVNGVVFWLLRPLFSLNAASALAVAPMK